MNASFKICAIGIAISIICVLIKHYKNDFIIPARLGGTLVIFGIIITVMTPILEYFNKLMNNVAPIEYMELILKSLAIAYMTQISSTICRDCEEKSIASAIESVGRLEIIILSLPLINEIVETAKELVSW